MVRPLIAGNWKMHGLRSDLDEIAAMVPAARALGDVADMLICPPATLMHPAHLICEGTPLLLGAQTCHGKEYGAFTGAIGAPMLADLGCSHVIVGHSERRANGETDQHVHDQARAAMRAGLTPIICVGEALDARHEGRAVDFVLRQVRAATGDSWPREASLAFAYEPIWAIGSGETATASDIADMHQALREALVEALGAQKAASVRLLYGGSVKPDNARDILHIDDVNGVLVGGASLTARSFNAIAEATLS